MKKLLCTILIALFVNNCFSQIYVALAPALTNNAGTLAQKTNVTFELGKQWDVFSLGLDLGKTSIEKVKGRDTTTYLELRPNLNVFQQGKFTNTFTAGIGYIFHSRQSFMTELTSGIEYAYNSQVHLNVYFGQYYYSGKYEASNTTFFGISGMFYFLPSRAKSLISPKPDK